MTKVHYAEQKFRDFVAKQLPEGKYFLMGIPSDDGHCLQIRTEENGLILAEVRNNGNIFVYIPKIESELIGLAEEFEKTHPGKEISIFCQYPEDQGD